MAATPLKVEKREITGRKVNSLRRQGILPGNVFGKDIKSFTIQVATPDFKRVYAEVGETGLVELTLGTAKHPVLVSNLHVNPVTGDPLHVDFHEVNLKEKVTATVPVEMEGESPIEKTGEGTVVQQLHEVEVEALPTDLPESFIVDVSNLTEVDQAIYVKDLKFDRTKIEIQAEEDAIVVKVEPPQKEEEVVVEAPVEGEEGAEATAAEGGPEVPTEGGEEAAAPEEKAEK